MRRIAALLVLAVTVAGCGQIKRTFGIKDEPPAHREPKTTSIYGNWVLDNVDSTAFAGAKVVELALQPTTFTITAWDQNDATTTVSGSVAYGEGLLTLTPTGGSGATPDRWGGAFVPGRPISITASAAGGSLVFAPPPTNGVPAVVPSSVWHKKDQAKAAVIVPPTN